MVRTFGIDEMARARFERRLAKKKALERGEEPPAPAKRDADEGDASDSAAMQLIPIIELCRYCPGMVAAMGTSVGLTGAAIASKGSSEQMERWALDILTMDKIGSWAITEPGAGSDAFGSMMSSAKAQPDGTWLLNGNKTFITNAPYADTIVFICKLDEAGVDPQGPKGAERSSSIQGHGRAHVKPKPMRKMGACTPRRPASSSCRTSQVGVDRLLGGKARRSRRAQVGRQGDVLDRAFPAWPRCRSASSSAVSSCPLQVREGARAVRKRPIGEFQLIQDKLARMEVARMNLQNQVFRLIEATGSRVGLTFREASAIKLYAARAAVEVAMEAVQVFGGNGYTAEYPVEQLARDAKALQIYAGTDEIQISAIARDLLSR